MERIILLVSFIKRSELNESLNTLKNSKKIVNNKIFVLRDSSNDSKLILTYNIFLNDNERIDFNSIIKGTISLHRKKDTNTLYSLNALNEIIKLETNKKDIDKNYQVNWEKYRNCILLHSSNGLNKIKTIIEKIITI